MRAAKKKTENSEPKPRILRLIPISPLRQRAHSPLYPKCARLFFAIRMYAHPEANSLQSKPDSRASKTETPMSHRSRESKLAELRAKTDGDLANVIHRELAF